MTIYAWPATWKPSRFEMRVLPNTRTFIGPYTPTTQVLDLLGERWQISMDLPATTDPVLGAAREAFFDRLKGPANLIAMAHQRSTVPQGTLRDGGGLAQWKTVSGTNATWLTAASAAATWAYVGPTIGAAAPVGSNSIVIGTSPGKALLAGDMIGAAAQLFRAMADAVADSAGRLVLEVQPRVRAALSIGATVTCTAPTANFLLKAEGVPVAWRPGMSEGVSLDLIEAI